jgi:hypothetical protein
MTNSKKEHVKMTNNRPPSCDLPPEFYELKLKPCPLCGAEAERSSCNKSVIRCSDINCLTYGPWGDPHGHKWNSIPRRSAVLELIRLVETTERDLRLSKLYERFKAVVVFADKLRKEMEG